MRERHLGLKPMVVLGLLWGFCIPCPNAFTQTLTIDGATQGTVSANAGALISVEVSGASTTTDWVSLAVAGGAIIDWQYMNGTRTVPGGVIPSATLVFRMPYAVGSYLLRFYKNNSSVVSATSPAIATQWPSSTVAVDGLSLPDPDTIVDRPSRTVTVSVTQGTGSRSDWVGLYLRGGTSTLSWQYLNGLHTLPATGVFDAELTFTLPPTAGAYEFRFFANNTFTALAQSPVIVAGYDVYVAGELPPAPVVVPPGSTVDVSVVDGPGYPKDWLKLVAKPSNQFITWKYLNGSGSGQWPAQGLTDATVPFTLPVSEGSYVFDFHANDSYSVIGTSREVVTSCVTSISKRSVVIVASAAADTVSVLAPAGCTWAASVDQPFLTLTMGASGTGNGTVGYSATANGSAGARVGRLTIGGHAIDITQAGTATDTSTCSFSVSGSVSTAQSGAFGIAAPTDCAWTSTVQTQALSVDSTGGTGSAAIGYQLDPAWAPPLASSVALGGTPTALQASSLTGRVCIQIPIVRIDSSQFPIQWIQLCGYPRLQSPPPPPTQTTTPYLTIDRNPVERGGTILVGVANYSGYTFRNWRFEASDATLGNVLRSSDTGSRLWRGTIVTSGTIKVTARKDGQDLPTLVATVTVTPRSGWKWQAVEPQKKNWPFTTPGGFALDPPNPPNSPNPPVVGESALDWMTPQGSASTVNDNGPNHAFKYFINPLSQTGGGYSHAFYWVVAPDVENPLSEFYTKQCGDFNPATQTGTFISGSALSTQTARHEAGTTESHHRNYKDAQDNDLNNLGVYWESAVAGRAVSTATFQQEVGTELGNRTSQINFATFSLLNEPEPVNYSATGQYLGNINFAPNYATCP